MIVVVITILAILLVIYWYRQKNLPPGPWGLPIIGYLPWLDPKAPYETLTELSKKYGSVYSLYLGSVFTVVISDHKIVKQLFAKDVTTGRAPLYLTHGIMKGYGLICAEGELWKDQRKFAYACLKQFGASKFGSKRNKMEELIMKEAIDLVEHIKSKGDRVVLEPLEVLRHNVGAVITRVVFGKSWARDDPIWKWQLHLQEEGTKHVGVAGPLNFLSFLRFVPKFKRTIDFLINGQRKTHLFYKQLIDEEIARNKDHNEAEIGSVLNSFLEERQKRQNTSDLEKFYNDQQFYHLIADMFGAGLDTTLTTLRWFVLFLAVNQDIQTKLHEELKLLRNNNPTLDDLESLPLMEACIAETQRIRSVVPVGIPHGSLSEMNYNGFKIPKTTMIVPLQWAIHMNPENWEDPEKFDPWRFIDYEGRFKKPEAFIPFQTGKRMCVGDELARMLLFLFGATIFQHFHISLQTSEEVDLTGECGITLTPKEYELIFEKLI